MQDEKLVNVDTILDFLKDAVENKKVLPPTTWVDAAQKLTSLIEDESDKLFDMQQEIAQEKIRMLESDQKQNVSAVKLRIEASDLWVRMMKQDAKIKRVWELVRIAKIQARIRESEMRGY